MNLGFVLVIFLIVYAALVLFGVLALPSQGILITVVLILMIVALLVWLFGAGGGGFNWPWRRGP